MLARRSRQLRSIRSSAGCGDGMAIVTFLHIYIMDLAVPAYRSPFITLDIESDWKDKQLNIAYLDFSFLASSTSCL